MEERNQPRRPRRDAEQPQQKSESLIYGKNPVTELLKSGSGVDTVLIAEGMALAFLLRLLCIAARTARLVTFFHLFMLLPFRAGGAAPERFILFMIIQDKVYHISPGFATNCRDFIARR